MLFVMRALRLARKIKDWPTRAQRPRPAQKLLPKVPAAEQTSHQKLPRNPPETTKTKKRSPKTIAARPEKKVLRTTAINPQDLDAHAVQAIKRLVQAGHRAYLVGGCVRDLLLGITPKDFDIATSAHPQQVRAIFRNARIIGRRFRIVHLYFRSGHIIEVSTFRANVPPEEEDAELIVDRDNVFGTEEEDALRRDFRVNGLFYDVVRSEIVDYVHGLEDIDVRALRMIGDPDVRLREDPVRILRAIRLSTKTGLQIDPELYRAMLRHKDEILKCSTARIHEEVMRLLRIGYAKRLVLQLEELGLLDLLIPELGFKLREGSAQRETHLAYLAALDTLAQQQEVTDQVIYATLLWAILELENFDQKAKSMLSEAQLSGYGLALTKKRKEQLRQLYTAQRFFTAGEKRPPRQKSSLLQRPYFHDALDLFEVRAHATQSDLSQVAYWRHRQKQL